MKMQKLLAKLKAGGWVGSAGLLAAVVVFVTIDACTTGGLITVVSPWLESLCMICGLGH